MTGPMILVLCLALLGCVVLSVLLDEEKRKTKSFRGRADLAEGRALQLEKAAAENLEMVKHYVGLTELAVQERDLARGAVAELQAQVRQMSER